MSNPSVGKKEMKEIKKEKDQASIQLEEKNFKERNPRRGDVQQSSTSPRLMDKKSALVSKAKLAKRVK